MKNIKKLILTFDIKVILRNPYLVTVICELVVVWRDLYSITGGCPFLKLLFPSLSLTPSLYEVEHRPAVNVTDSPAAVNYCAYQFKILAREL